MIIEGNCSYACKFVALYQDNRKPICQFCGAGIEFFIRLDTRHCANDIFQIQGIYFDGSYSPVAHNGSFGINITITSMHRLTAIILDISNALHNKNVPIMKYSVSFHNPII